MLTSMPPTQMPCFPGDSFPMPPNFTVTHISGWHLSFLPSLVIRPVLLGVAAFFRARGLAKATRPLTCTHFDPCQSPQFSLHPGLPCHWNCFRHIAPNRTHRISSGLFIHFIQAKVQIVTQAHSTIKLFLEYLTSHRFRALMMIVLLISLANPAE